MNIRKRNGELQTFDINRVVNAVFAALQESGESDRNIAIEIAKDAQDIFIEHNLQTVEDMQDVIEGLLMEQHPRSAKAFIIYRHTRKQERNKKMPHYNYLTQQFLKPYFKKPNPFSTSMGEFVYYRTYARAIPEENRRETWVETVARVVEFSTDLEVMALQKAGKEITPAYRKELCKIAEQMFDAMYNMQLFPSGRSLFVGGSKASYASKLCNFNCSMMVMDELKKFAELSLVSMLGVGVGINLQNKYISQLPKVNTKIEIIHQDYRSKKPHERKDFTSLEDRGHGIIDIVVGDSRFGWAKAIEMYLEIVSSKQYEDINFIVFNYDNIRPLGERLKTFGGFASGHIALQNIFINLDKAIRSDIKENKWKQLSSLDCLDIATSIAEGVVAGGTRRSSLICFADPDDREVLEAKQNLYTQDASGNWTMDKTISHRTMSNNTVIYEEKPSLETLQKHFELIRDSAEPGLLNQKEMVRRNPNAKGTNPCFTGDMKLLTANGYKSFNELDGQNVEVVSYDGSITQGKVWQTGIKETIKLTLSNKTHITCTPDHRFMLTNGKECEAQHLLNQRVKYFVKPLSTIDNEYVKLGFIQGDGQLSRLSSNTHHGIEVNIGKKDFEVMPLFKNNKYTTQERKIYVQDIKEQLQTLGFCDVISCERIFPSSYSTWTDIQKRSFLRGCFTANGTVIKNTRIAYKTTSKAFANELMQALSEFDIQTNLTTNKKKTNVFSNGEYLCSESYDININRFQSCVLFAELIGFVQTEKNEKLHYLIDVKSPKIISIKKHKTEAVYDFHEPKHHWGVVEGVVAHNCGEILLDDRQTCNLTEINLSAFVNEDGTYNKQSLLEAQKLSATIGYRMASVELELHEWDKAAKKDMLLGCSLSGVADFINKTKISDNEFKILLQELRKVAHETANEYAVKFNMKPSTTVTTLKPSGSVSLLPSISAGIHYPHSDYYIRRVRISAADPLCKAMIEMGFVSVPENGQTEENHTTRVFSFPMKSPQGDNKFTVSALRQLELYKLLMENYVDANASNTITVRKEEWEDTVKWVHENWDSIVGMTFLELNDEFYQLAPYEKITQEEYEQLLSITPKFDANIANQSEDFSDLLDIAIDECSTGACPIR